MDQPTPNIEADWLLRARAGDSEAFGPIVEGYQVPVFNLCYRMLSDRGQAEDAAQETFLRAYRRLESYDGRRSVRTWLLSIAAHHCVDILRRRAVVRFEPIEERDFASGEAGPEKALIRREVEREVAGLLRGLPALDRAIVTLRYWYDLPLEEIAAAVGLSPNAVRTRLYRARRTMADRAGRNLRELPERGTAYETPAV